jgi:hypothetical protein
MRLHVWHFVHQIYPTEVPRLSARECWDMLVYKLAVTIFPGEQATRITDDFGRINSGGLRLGDQERRRAGVLSSFAELVGTLAAEFEATCLAKRSYSPKCRRLASRPAATRMATP